MSIKGETECGTDNVPTLAALSRAGDLLWEFFLRLRASELRVFSVLSLLNILDLYL